MGFLRKNREIFARVVEKVLKGSSWVDRDTITHYVLGCAVITAGYGAKIPHEVIKEVVIQQPESFEDAQLKVRKIAELAELPLPNYVELEDLLKKGL